MSIYVEDILFFLILSMLLETKIYIENGGFQFTPNPQVYCFLLSFLYLKRIVLVIYESVYQILFPLKKKRKEIMFF